MFAYRLGRKAEQAVAHRKVKVLQGKSGIMVYTSGRKIKQAAT